MGCVTFKHRGLRAPALSANKEGKHEMSNEFTQEGLRRPEDFRVGMLITPTEANPWVSDHPYLTILTIGKEYEVIGVDLTYVWLIDDRNRRTGFLHPPQGVDAWFKPAHIFSEEEIAQAVEFIQN